jgi:hypothetical protein
LAYENHEKGRMAVYLFGNRWLPQTNVRSGDLLPPSPPAEKASASKDQTGKACANVGNIKSPLAIRTADGVVLRNESGFSFRA